MEHSQDPRNIAARLLARCTRSEAGRRGRAANDAARSHIKPAHLTKAQRERTARNRLMYAVTRGLDLDCAMRVVRPGSG